MYIAQSLLFTCAGASRVQSCILIRAAVFAALPRCKQPLTHICTEGRLAVCLILKAEDQTLFDCTALEAKCYSVMDIGRKDYLLQLSEIVRDFFPFLLQALSVRPSDSVQGGIAQKL